MNDNIIAAAKLLRDAKRMQVPCNPVRFLIGTNTEDAYTVQKINTDLHLEKGYKAVGSKIGATSLAVQKQFGLMEPDFGILFNDGEIENGGKISLSEIMYPKVEGEIAFVLGKDLIAGPLSMDEVSSSIAHALVSIELLGSRIINWDITLADTIADNASASHYILGSKAVALTDIDLINCKMNMWKNGEIVSEGKGSDTMGSPLNSMFWLANKFIQLGTPMRAGDIILTGALGPVIDVRSGDNFTIEITGLGEASVNFTD